MTNGAWFLDQGNSPQGVQWETLWGRERVGGKAHHLAGLVHHGLPVPSFGALTVKTFHFHRNNGHFPEGVMAQVLAAVKTWGTQFVSVRSSMTAEDSDVASFAGILESFLFVRPEDIEVRVKDCYQALHADRVQLYFREKNIPFDPEKIGVAVVIQAMIDSQSSGVAFSRSPDSYSSLIYIEAGRGLGEGIVSGQVEVDQYWWDRFGKEWQRKIARKRSAILYDLVQHQVRLEVEANLDAPRVVQPALSHAQLQELHRHILKIETSFAKPSDIEWATDPSGKVFILQTRAITEPIDPVKYFIDTNLAESYPGVVSPMTASFVKRAYTKVISEGLLYLGLDPKDHPSIEKSLQNLIAEFASHLYYDLESYYQVLASFPGGKANVEAWHKMIGGSLAAIAIQIPEIPAVTKFKMNFRLAQLVLRHRMIFRDWDSNAKRTLDRLEDELAHTPNAQASAKFTLKAMREVQGWGLTILNDFLVIIGLRIIDHYFKKFAINPEDLGAILHTKKGVESMDALNGVQALVQELRRDSKLAECLNGNPKDFPTLFATIQSTGHSAFAERIRSYLAQFGDRSFEELKLESMTFAQDVSVFLSFLKWNLDSMTTGSASTRHHNEPHDQRREFWKAWPAKDRLLFQLTLKRTELAIQARESTRLMRGRYYGLIRKAVLRMAQQLRQESDLFREFQTCDYFSLTLEDFESAWNLNRLAQVIAERGAWKTLRVEYPERVTSSPQDSSHYFVDLQSQSQEAGPSVWFLHQKSLQGLGASPGLVEGVALVVRHPQDAMARPDLGNCILITRSTDPAWIFIMSKCRGLVTEKGSLLSHTAIVGRELKIPTVVGLENACRRIPSGTLLRINGKTGQIEVLGNV